MAFSDPSRSLPKSPPRSRVGWRLLGAICSLGESRVDTKNLARPSVPHTLVVILYFV